MGNTNTEPVVDFFTGTKFSVSEIVLGRNVMEAQLRILNRAHAERNATDVKLAAEKIARCASEISTLAAHLARVSTTHLNRRPRP